MSGHLLNGFSGLSKLEKLELVSRRVNRPEEFKAELKSCWHGDTDMQDIYDNFSENTLSNYYLPYGVAPNFLINGRDYVIPMVIEESSVVAAASGSAKFWYERGGFTSRVLSTEKVGSVYFTWTGDGAALLGEQKAIADYLLAGTRDLTRSMEARGGGITRLELIDMREQIPDMYQLRAGFNTVDSMGANFINSCLEEFARGLKEFADSRLGSPGNEGNLEILMAILSNYTTECIVECAVECGIRDFDGLSPDLDAAVFVERFRKAVRIAETDPYRAVTHNKGIFNGIDAVVLATGNDFRAVEAGGHAYASRSGRYSSLTHLETGSGRFRYVLTVPLSVGTVGGLTTTHPLARQSLELLGNPGSVELMEIVAAAGLANNFAAVRSLVTTGIQKGHMRMHLSNILNRLQASDDEKAEARSYFAGRTISHHSVEEYLKKLRGKTGYAGKR